MTDFFVAGASDWPFLKPFYDRCYREHHPLQYRPFWDWQYGDPNHGRLLIGVEDNEVVAHLGLIRTDGRTFNANLYVRDDHRLGDTYLRIVEESLRIAPHQYAISVSPVATDALRLEKWHQYAPLERRLRVDPDYRDADYRSLTAPVSIKGSYKKPHGHFWEQPTLEGILLDDGSTAVAQVQVGGLRFVDLVQPARAVAQAFEMGFRWCDFITSFNNPILFRLNKGWLTDDQVDVPWLLNPVVPGSKGNLNFFANKPMDIGFYVTFRCSDMGRVGQINQTNLI